MKFALFDHMPWLEGTEQTEVLRETVEQVQWAEQLGFDAAWLAEHHFSRYGLGSASLVIGTHLAAKTTTIRFGTAIAIAPIRHPVMLAEEAATLDLLSGGRLDFGIGAGGPFELHGFNVPLEESRPRFQEVVDMVLGLWTSPVYSHAGRFFQANGVSLVPRPAQHPHPPVYAAVRNPASMEFAADRGLKLMTGVLPTFDEAAEQRRFFVRTAAERGRPVDPAELPYFRYVYLAESESQARRDAAEHLIWVWEMIEMQRAFAGTGGAVHASYDDWLAGRAAPSLSLEEILANRALVGTPDQCLARLRELRDEHGVGYFGGNFGFGGLPQAKVLRSMELFAREVMPHLAG